MADAAAATDNLILALTTAITSHGLYPRGHPQAEAGTRQLLAALIGALAARESESVTFLLVDNELAVDGEPWRRAALYRPALIGALSRRRVERVTFAAGVTVDELTALAAGLAHRGSLAGSEHVVLGRVAVGDGSDEDGSGKSGSAGSIEAALDQVHSSFDELLASGAEGFVRLESAVWDLMEETASESRTLALLASLKGENDRLYRHSTNVCLHVLYHARLLGLEGAVVHDLGVAALLHDIGLLELPPELLEPGHGLDENERVLLRRHPALGAAKLAGISGVPALPILVAFEHHQRWDGRGGYPIAGRRPTFAAQLTAVSDTWDMLRTAAEKYPPGERHRLAATGLKKRAGNHLDAFLAGTFLALVEPG